MANGREGAVLRPSRAHGLIARGSATVAFVNQNRRDIRFGNHIIPVTFFEPGGVKPELQRLQWNPRQAGPSFTGSIRYRDLERTPPQTGGGAGPHLLAPEALRYLLDFGTGAEEEVVRFSTPKDDRVEPYDFPLSAARYAWLNGLSNGAVGRFSLILPGSWGSRPDIESLGPQPRAWVAGDPDEAEGVVAIGVEIPSLGLRYWSLDRDAEINGRAWRGDSRVILRGQSSGVGASRVEVDIFVGPEQVPDRGALLGHDIIVRWFHNRAGRWVPIPNTFPGKVANMRLRGLVMSLQIDPGPYPQTLDDRRFSRTRINRCSTPVTGSSSM